MPRYIPQWLSPVVEELELNRPSLVTASDLEEIIRKTGVNAQSYTVADRLKKHGWLLETTQRGVWEFSPAENAGAYSSYDPLLPIKAFSLGHTNCAAALTMQTAAWALGLADRVPACIEVCFSTRPNVKIPREVHASVFQWVLEPLEEKGFACLCPESIIVQMAQKPTVVRSWESSAEWLSDVAYEIDSSRILCELENRPTSVWARTGYLLSGMRPDVSREIEKRFTPTSKTRFGARTKALRNSERWMISDTILPFDPEKLEALR